MQPILMWAMVGMLAAFSPGGHATGGHGVVHDWAGIKSVEDARRTPHTDMESLGVCGWYFFGGCDDGWHKVQGPAPDGYHNLHGDCRLCILGDCHPTCGVSEEEEDVQLAYERALDALANGRIEALLSGARQIPEYVVVNPERGSVQVMDCRKEFVVGSLLIPDGMMVD